MEQLQMWFYVIAIIFMLSMIGVLVVAGIALWKIQQAVKELPDRVEGKLASIFDSNKFQIVSMVGLPVASFILGRIKGFFFRK